VKTFLATIAAFAALAALSAPAFADSGRLDVVGLAPVGNIPHRGIDYGLSYAVAKVGPVRLSPLAEVDSAGGQATFHLGASATVLVAKHFDVGVAEVQRPGFAGFTRMGTSAIVGVRL
jgi:hypothetical protein